MDVENNDAGVRHLIISNCVRTITACQQSVQRGIVMLLHDDKALLLL